MDDRLDRYVEEHGTFGNDALDWLERQTNIRTTHPRMLAGKGQGELLYMLTRMIRPKRVLEIGTFTGYSAICMALGLPDGGHLDTVEVNDELEELTLEGFKRAGVSGLVTLHICDALGFLSKAAECKGAGEDALYDMVFIDANKREYSDYYRLVVDMTRPGGFILADDVLWDGKVFAEHVPSDKQTKGVVEFNETVSGDPRVETMILPIRHGLGIIRKK